LSPQSPVAVILLLPNRGGKTVSAFRYGLDVSRPPGNFSQRLSKCRNINGEVGILDIAVGPDLLHEFIFAEKPTVAPNEDD
jgi:hypothetical protein